MFSPQVPPSLPLKTSFSSPPPPTKHALLFVRRIFHAYLPSSIIILLLLCLLLSLSGTAFDTKPNDMSGVI